MEQENREDGVCQINHDVYNNHVSQNRHNNHDHDVVSALTWADTMQATKVMKQRKIEDIVHKTSQETQEMKARKSDSERIRVRQKD